MKLDGIIPAGGTYLIRGAQHSKFDDVNSYLKVKTFDQEWFNNGELVSFEVDDTALLSTEMGYGFCITYGETFEDAEITPTTKLVRRSNSGDTVTGLVITDTKTYPYLITPHFIDGLYFYKMVTAEDGSGYWATTAVGIKENTIYKNTFELDPAKQAFQAFTLKDSSRTRWSSGTDIQIVDLSKETISFPHTEEDLPVANYTPKASFDKKNVCTGKTSLNEEKPNLVSCGFGIDIYKTRCFNWISVGYFDEYVWFKKTGETSWEGCYNSYMPVHGITVTEVNPIQTPELETTGYELRFEVTDSGFSQGLNISKFTELVDSNSSLLISGLSIDYDSENNIYYTNIGVDDLGDISVSQSYILKNSDDDLNSAESRKKFFSSEIINNIYSRRTGRFPGNETFFTSHKVIVDIIDESNVVTPTEYTYVVGRKAKNGEPDLSHCSDEQTFTLYPNTYTPRIYQTTDQQGFHWIEYQVWSAAAKKLSEKIEEDINAENIIPILVNTGDISQNGTRINEWLDYYNGGKPLLSKLEHMAVTGNNDLCGTNPEDLGTGDDIGKSNSYYFHLINCNEIDESVFNPLVANISDNSIESKLVPSLYYIDTISNRVLFLNSEITEINCRDWFGLNSPDGKVVNIYTGYEIDNSNNGKFINGYTTIYNMVWSIMNDAKTKNKSIIAAMHELPFTVIKADSLLNGYTKVSRSISNSGKLVGSHMNQISANEVANSTNSPKGAYWFSRLCEYFGVKVCIGGHKHTYTCTYPVRENYLYGPNEEFSSKVDGIMDMSSMSTLESDTANFISGEQDLSKYPLTKRAEMPPRSEEGFYPYVPDPDLTGGVVYFMCQASGYKLSSNKELPSPNQAFTWVLPKTTSTYNSSTGVYTDKPSAEQKYPMFSIIELSGEDYLIKLARLTNIMVSGAFNQYVYGSGEIGLQWLTKSEIDNYGSWVDEEKSLTTLSESDWL